MGVLRAEIRRLARKETKEAVRDLKRQVAALRRRMAMTKKRMGEVERAAMRAGSARAAAPAAASAEGDGTQIRFSPRWVRVHRSRLGMSRRVYAKLVGVSPQTILLWESGKARPRRSALASWRSIRGKGIRELKAAAGGETGGRRGRRARVAKGAGAAKRTRRGRPARRKKAAAVRPRVVKRARRARAKKK
jgi:DNA-binding transcriptional regulator YiaG